jgi:hypothetical protein
MEEIITKEMILNITAQFAKVIFGILSAKKTLAQAESELTAVIKRYAAKFIKLYIASLDAELLRDKAGRRQAGLAVQRKGDERSVQMLFGEITFQRTYYKRKSGGYEYPIDVLLGIESRERVSAAISQQLVAAAREMSYAKASKYVTDSAVSKQTVMHCVRQGAAIPTGKQELRRVPELHIDADEAHATLCGGYNTEVPLISVYEGIAHNGKRNSCKNSLHISEYGKKPDALWEQALTEIEKRYDLTDTKLYLHGDGGTWIHTGLDWLPNCDFVLDKYHKNKAITHMTASFAKNKDRNLYGREIREALDNEDLRYLGDLTESICLQFEDRRANIEQSSNYLARFVKGISICKTDPRANNGGCTEPHISHILASRLSTRPMAWSKQTLRAFAPVLAAKEFTVRKKAEPRELPEPLRKTADKARQVWSNTVACLPMPGAVGTLPFSGKLTEGLRELRMLA